MLINKIYIILFNFIIIYINIIKGKAQHCKNIFFYFNNCFSKSDNKKLNNETLIVSMTSFPARIKIVKISLNSIINQKISSGQYTSNNTDEYLKDYEAFINGYKSEAKGNYKLKCLIDFLEVNKPNYFKYLINSLEKDNQAKISNANKMLEDSKKRKNQQEAQYRQLNEQTEEKNKKVEDICSQIERKKREIKSLNAEIERMEEEIKKAQSQDGKGIQ